MGDWSGQIYVNEGHDRLYHGMTKVRHDGVQEALQGKKRIFARAPSEDDSHYESDWWSDMRSQNANKAKDGDNCDRGNAPMSLFKMSLSFVASHLSYVDSLIGFPDEVGRQLFEEARHLGQFRHPPSCVEPFRLFCEAYGPGFVSSLTLSKISISSSICEIITKSCGTVLEEIHLKDTAFESSGITQSLLQGLGQMPRLRKLSLIGCDLKDADIRLLTAHTRIYAASTRTGPIDLEELDLSGNYNVSGVSVRYVRVFSKLRLLTMTGTSVESNNGCDQLDSIGLELATTAQISRILAVQKGKYDSNVNPASASSFPSSFSSSAYESPFSVSVPWADPIFADWQKTLPPDENTDKENKRKNNPKFKFSTFYNPTKERAKEARMKNSHAVPLVFMRRKMAGSKTSTSSTSSLSSNQSRKRKRGSNLVEADSVLNQLFDDDDRGRFEEENRPVDFTRFNTSQTQSQSDDCDFASQYSSGTDAFSKRAKTAKTSFFDLL